MKAFEFRGILVLTFENTKEARHHGRLIASMAPRKGRRAYAVGSSEATPQALGKAIEEALARESAPSAEKERDQGWAWPPNSRKAHYFLKGETISLCSKWMYGGEREDTLHEHPDNCSTCEKRWAKLYR